MSLDLRWFKAVRAQIRWAPLVVAFGPNNAGKTNLLEGIADALGLAGSSRADSLIDWSDEDWDWPGFNESSALVELDLGDDSERALLAELVQYESVEWSLGAPSRVSLGDVLNRSQAQWGFGDMRESLAPGPASLKYLKARALEVLSEAAEMYCSDWDAVGADWQVVMKALLESRHLALGAEEIRWVYYRPGGPPRSVKNAASRLLERRDVWPDPANPHPEWQGLADGSDPISWVRLGYTTEGWLLGLFDATYFATDSTSRPVEGAVQEAIEKALRRGGWVADAAPWAVVEPRGDESGGGMKFQSIDPASVDEAMRARRTSDPWLATMGEGVGTAPMIGALTNKLAAVANDLAPPVVRAHGDLVVEALPPQQWRPNEERRVRVALRDQNGRDHALNVVGSGVAMWAAISIFEAMNRLKRHADPPKSPIPLPDDGTSESFRLLRVRRPRVYLVDEPERHLHPVAQREIAKWLVDLTRQPGAPTVLVASHAPAFLDMPAERVEYLAVRRDQTGLTTLSSLDERLVEAGDTLSHELGLTRSDLIQLTRAILIVEGRHDVLVAEHFYGDLLSQERIRVLPIHGTDNALALVEAEFLRSVGIPIVILFDNTSKARPWTKEWNAIRTVLRSWDDPATAPWVVDLDLPDVFCAIPDTIVHAHLASMGIDDYPGWNALIRAWKKSPPENFKDFILRRLGVEQAATPFLEGLLHDAPRAPLRGESAPYDRAMNEVLALARSRFIPES